MSPYRDEPAIDWTATLHWFCAVCRVPLKAAGICAACWFEAYMRPTWWQAIARWVGR
jgi:hypothetical protein